MKITRLTYKNVLICSALILTVGTLIGGKLALIYFAIGLSFGVVAWLFIYICRMFHRSSLSSIPLDEMSPPLALATCLSFMSLTAFLGIILIACAMGVEFTWLANPIEIAIAQLTTLVAGLSLGGILVEWHSLALNQGSTC